MSTFEVLHIEDGVFYIRYYPDGMECKGINMKLNRVEFESFCYGKVEV